MPRFPAASPTSLGLSSAVYSSLVERAKARGKKVHPLHVGDTHLEPFEGARAEAQRTAEHPLLHAYPPVHGVPALLAALSKHLSARAGRTVPIEDIQVTAGATSGLCVVQALFDPGDEVILLSPFWPLIRGIVASRGAVPVEVPFFDRVGRADFDVEKVLEGAIGPRTVGLYVNTPNNPTGRVLDAPALDAIARVAERHGLWVLSDEAYESFWFQGPRPEPLWNHPKIRDRAIASHTFSKSYGMAGARVAYVHGPSEALQRIRAVHTFQAYSAPQPMQWGALRALEGGDPWIEAARGAYREGGHRAAKALGLPPPEGGTFLFFDAAPYFRQGEDLLAFLERAVDEGVLLTPGSACGKDYGTFVRLCFTAVPPADLDEAVTALRRVMGSAREL